MLVTEPASAGTLVATYGVCVWASGAMKSAAAIIIPSACLVGVFMASGFPKISFVYFNGRERPRLIEPCPDGEHHKAGSNPHAGQDQRQRGRRHVHIDPAHQRNDARHR